MNKKEKFLEDCHDLQNAIKKFKISHQVRAVLHNDTPWMDCLYEIQVSRQVVLRLKGADDLLKDILMDREEINND